MARTGVGTLGWILFLSVVRTVRATDCSTLISGSTLEVPTGTECTVGDNLNIPAVTVTVYGTMTITVKNVTITVTDLEIKAGAILAANAVSTGGDGAGNSLGSGGTAS